MHFAWRLFLAANLVILFFPVAYAGVCEVIVHGTITRTPKPKKLREASHSEEQHSDKSLEDNEEGDEESDLRVEVAYIDLGEVIDDSKRNSITFEKIYLFKNAKTFEDCNVVKDNPDSTEIFETIMETEMENAVLSLPRRKSGNYSYSAEVQEVRYNSSRNSI